MGNFERAMSSPSLLKLHLDLLWDDPAQIRVFLLGLERHT